VSLERRVAASSLTPASDPARPAAESPVPAAGRPCPPRGTARVSGTTASLLGRRGRTGASLLVVGALLLSTGCSVLTPLVPGAGQVHTVDPNAPFVVVTVGGVPAATPTAQGVAPTIPDSTPLPKPELPARDPATPRPVASPSLNRGGSAAAQAARPPDASVPTFVASPAAGN
jgi:hypothetical protein